MKVRKIAALALGAVLTLAAVAGCAQDQEPETKYYGENYRPELSQVDRSHFYGAMYIAYEMDRWNNLPYELGVQTLKNMGVQSIRLDLFAQECFPTMSAARIERNETEIAKVHSIIAAMQDAGMLVIGCVNPNWVEGMGFQGENVPMPRNDREGSEYQAWLSTYQRNWQTVVAEFSELTYFEIGNETNQGGAYLDGSGNYDMLEKADIYTDMLYAASSGIHAANKNAVSIMGGLAEFVKLGTSVNDAYITFLTRIYDNIASGAWPSMYTDDYFQAVAWHPYVFHDWDADYFVEENQRVYDLIKEREGKDKKVFFTEIGWSDKMVVQTLPGKTVQETIAVWLTDMYQTVKERMPYVESVQVFRAFNDVRDYNWAGESSMGAYGLFYDANWEIFKGSEENLRETDPATGKCVVPGTPKPAAVAYQQMTGATGSLNLLRDRAEAAMKELGWWNELVSLM